MMNALHKTLCYFFLVPFVLFAQLACAEDSGVERYQAGTHYEVLPKPIRVAPSDKIEVMEVFWYGCSHCYDFEPLIVAWKKTLADDVVFLRTPAAWDRGGVMRKHASMYYAAESLGVLDQVHPEIFELLSKDRRLTDDAKFAEVFARHGIDAETLQKTLDGFSMPGKLDQAESRTRKNYRTQGTPEVVVNGKYRVSSTMAGDQAAMLSVVDYLIEKERENN